MATPQVFHAHSSDLDIAITAMYDVLTHAYDAGSGTSFIATTATRVQVVGLAGVFDDLSFELDTPPGVGSSWTYVIVRNGVDQNGSGGTPDTRVIISDAATSGSNTNALTVAAGDIVYLKRTGIGAPAAHTHRRSIKFTPTAANRFMLPFFFHTVLTNVLGTTYGGGLAPANTWSATLADGQWPVPMGCTLVAVYFINAAAISAGSTVTFRINKGGVDQASADVAYTNVDAVNTVKSKTGLSIAFTAGDLLTIKSVISGVVPGSGKRYSVCLVFSNTTDGEAIVAGGMDGTLNAAQRFTNLAEGSGQPPNATIGTRDYLVTPTGFVAKSLYVQASAAPGTAADKYQFAVMKNGSAVESVEIVGAAVQATSAGPDTFDVNDTMAMGVNSVAAASTATNLRWSMVVTVTIGAPPPPPPPPVEDYWVKGYGTTAAPLFPPLRLLVLPPSRHYTYGRVPTASVGTVKANYPLSNMTDDDGTRVTRITGTSGTFDIDLGATKSPNLMAWFNTTIPAGTTMRVLVSTVAGFATPILDILVSAQQPGFWLDLRGFALAPWRYARMMPATGTSKAVSVGEWVIGLADELEGVEQTVEPVSRSYHQREFSEFGVLYKMSSDTRSRGLRLGLSDLTLTLRGYLEGVFGEAGMNGRKVVVIPNTRRNDATLVEWPGAAEFGFPQSDQVTTGLLDLVEENFGVV